jgi:hypothetical protein
MMMIMMTRTVPFFTDSTAGWPTTESRGENKKNRRTHKTNN